MVNVHAVLQARMSSSRLPGKVLADLSGQPMIIRQLERISLATRIDHVTVVITDQPSDDKLFRVLSDHGVDVRRGSLKDVASRYFDVIEQDTPKNVVRLTADCPLTDWIVIDEVIEAHIDSCADYTSNTLKRTYPAGLDVEVFTADSFRVLCEEGLNSYEMEHVTPAYYSPDSGLVLRSVEQEEDESFLRWTVDYPSDLDFVQFIYAQLYKEGAPFSAMSVRSLNRRSA